MALVGVFLLLFLVVLVIELNRQQPQQSPVAYISTEQAAQQQQLAQLEAQKPSASAPASQRADYYEKLFFAQGNAGDYTSAVQTFKTRESISSSGLGYRDYFSLAQYYCKLNNITSARAALATEQALLPAQDDLENGYSRANTLLSIDNLSKDCTL